MSRNISWRWPTAEETVEMIRQAIRRGRATQEDLKELALAKDESETAMKRSVDLLQNKFGITQVPADPEGDGLIHLWPRPKDEPVYWEEIKRETKDGRTTIEMKFIGPARQRGSKSGKSKRGSGVKKA